MIKKAKDADIYTPEEIKKIRERIREVNGIPIREIGVTTLISTVEHLQEENERLQAVIEDLESEVRRFKNRIPTNPAIQRPLQRGLEYGC